ncbi:hypothetical protein L195_g059118, partial [Trifolium pratense]
SSARVSSQPIAGAAAVGPDGGAAVPEP